MATRFKVTCSECGPQVVNSPDMTVLMNRLPVGTTYVFTCPVCATPHSAAANASLVSTLTSHGVRVVRDLVPEPGAKRDTPINDIEAAFLIHELNEIDLLAEAVERWVSSDGKNWTPRKADDTEGAGGEGQSQ